MSEKTKVDLIIEHIEHTELLLRQDDIINKLKNEINEKNKIIENFKNILKNFILIHNNNDQKIHTDMLSSLLFNN
jgi:hypothetical protein